MLHVLSAALEVESNPDAPGVVATVTGAGIALACLLVLRFVVGHSVTLAHEFGHAFVATLLGGSVKKLRIKSNQTGVTTDSPPAGFSKWGALDDAVIYGAGYIAPAVFGLLLADVLGHGNPHVVIWTTIVVLAIILPSVGSFFTFFTVVTLGTIFLVIAVQDDEQFTLLSAVTWVWILIAGGLFQLFEDFDGASDLNKMSKKFIGPMFWALLYSALTIVVMIEAGLILIGAKEPFL